MPPPTLEQLRRHAIARSLFRPTTLRRAIERLGFVQADPIRAPARAQDLVLRHRVRDYRAGDLERRYARLGLEEDFFVNYGLMPRSLQRLLHPRTPELVWSPERRAQAETVLAWVRERGVVHPREVDAHFAHGKATNWFGGSSNASTQLLDGMHHRGLLRVARREGGVRLYAAGEPPATPLAPAEGFDRLLDIAIRLYAPLPLHSIGWLASAVALGAAPQWRAERAAAIRRAAKRLPHARVDGHEWFWPEGENPASRRHRPDESVRLLAPFDPIVWDRRRFEHFWGWPYRFEAYVPAAKRVRGYYALPMLWREQVIGWGNLSWRDGRLSAGFGFVDGRAPRDAAFRLALDDELERMSRFLEPAGA